MTFNKAIYLILFSFPLSFSALAQEVTFVPHFPASGYMINRLIPFTVSSSVEIDILSVSLSQGSECKVAPDRYYKAVFHFYCTQPEQVSAEVIYIRGGEKLSSTTALIDIVEIASPSSSDPVPSTGSVFSKPNGDE